MTAPVSPGVNPKVKEEFEAFVVDAFSGESGDVIVELRLSRETLAVGATLPVSFTRRVPCETCKGSGRAEGAPPCEKCNGKGRVSHDVTEGGADATFVTTCGTCDGRGHAAEHACKHCQSGYTKVDDSAEVEIPMGSGSGMQLRIKGKGHVRPDKPQGDVVVVLSSGLENKDISVAQAKAPMMLVYLLLTVVFVILAVLFARQ